MIAKAFSAQNIGLNINILTIEVDITNGLHLFSIVGLPDKSVEESRDRVCAAIKNSGYVSPRQKNQKIIVSIAPAQIRKEGSAFDLSIALAYLQASKDIFFYPEDKLFLGELSLEGRIRRVNGVLPIVKGAVENGFKEIYVPRDNVAEAGLIKGIDIYGVESLSQIIDHLTNKKKVVKSEKTKIATTIDNKYSIDFSMIQGQENTKRSLLISACGGHNIAMYGPPGTGKTMLAKAFISILPPLSDNEIVEVTSIYSIANMLESDFIVLPPFRSPHHTSSYASLVGGGTFPKPGEITLSHRGVLFLDEFPEFEKNAIDALRQPLEESTVTISRAKGRLTFPAKCILIASMNPCPCGYGKGSECKCNEKDLVFYRKKLSGPIIDRIDIWSQVSKTDYEKLTNPDRNNFSSKKLKDIVVKTREIQLKRFLSYKIRNKYLNSEMDISDIQNIVKIDDSAKNILKNSAERLGLSGRAYHRVIKVAQTISDIEGNKTIKDNNILEALQYRQKGF